MIQAFLSVRLLVIVVIPAEIEKLLHEKRIGYTPDLELARYQYKSYFKNVDHVTQQLKFCYTIQGSFPTKSPFRYPGDL